LRRPTFAWSAARAGTGYRRTALSSVRYRSVPFVDEVALRPE
jgi:hypothetical protein